MLIRSLARSLVFAIALCALPVFAGTVKTSAAGPLHALTVDLTSLSLDSTSLHGVQTQCWQGTGFSAGEVTGVLKPVRVISIDALTTSSITVNFRSDSQAFSNVVCAVTGGSGGGVDLSGVPANSVLTKTAGAVAGDSNFLWEGGFLGSGGLYLGGHSTDLGSVAFSSFWPSGNAENYWSFTIPNGGHGYAEQGYFYWNSSSSSVQDLFYNGSAAVIDGSGAITDQAFYIESVPDYASEVAVRQHLVTLRSASQFCWNSADNAGGLIFSSETATPDTCIQRPAAGVVELNNGTQGQLITLKSLAYFHTPASSSESCIQGQTAEDASFHYVCTATNTWKRAALSSF